MVLAAVGKPSGVSDARRQPGIHPQTERPENDFTRRKGRREKTMGCPETAGEDRALHRRATIQRITEIAWSAAIASVVTIIVLTSLGWLTTQAVVEKAREQGAEELVALRAVICTVRFQQKPDALTKLAEFRAISYDRATAIKKFIADDKLATMVAENAPAAGAIDRCAYAISGLVG